MNAESFSLEHITASEEALDEESRKRLADLLSYTEFVEETLLVAFNNDGKLLKLDNVEDNPKPFVFFSTTRAFSIAHVAMKMTLRGYPLEGIALTRTLLELTQSTQYLARHPDLINGFITGTIKLEKVLKLAKAEHGNPKNASFGLMWGFASRFAHASPESIFLGLSASTGNLLTAHLLTSDRKRIDDTAHGITSALLAQYIVFHTMLFDDLSVRDQLKERDQKIFDRKNLIAFGGWSSERNNELDSLLSHFLSYPEEHVD